MRTDSLPELSEGAWPCGHLDFRFLASTAVRDKISHFPLEEVLATGSSVLAWRIPWTEELGGLQSIGSQSLTWLKQLSTKHASKIYKEFTQLNNKKKKQDFFLKNLLFLAIKCVVICYVSHRKWKGHSMLSVGSEMEELAGQVDTWAPLRREARAGDKALKGSWAYRWQFKPLSAQNLKHSPRSSFSEAQKQKLFRFWGTDFIHCYNQTPTLCINDIQYPYQIICL